MRLRTLVHDVDVKRNDGQTDRLADRLCHGGMHCEGEELGANHHLVVHALEYDGLNNALKQAVAGVDDLEILRTDNDIDRRILLEALVHALEGAAAELDLAVLEHHAVNDIGFADEIRNKGVDRLVVDIGRAADLLDNAVVHNDNAVTHRQRLFLVVGDVDKGDAGTLLNALQLDLHVLAQLEVEGAERLVEQQHTRLAHQCTRDGDTLLLTAGKTGHIAVFKAAQTNQLEHFCGFALDICAVQLFDVQTECNILRNIQVWEQRITLEYGVDLALIRRNIVQTLAVEEYIAGIRLGTVTNTQDITGEVLETNPVSATREDVLAALQKCTGDIEQMPPMYSAIKIGGQKLYELARRGVEVERQPRQITIFELELMGGAGCDYTLRVRCSKGTYVRTLCHDLGQMLGCGACMSSLRRTKAGMFTLSQAITLPQILEFAKENDPQELLMPVDALFSQYPPLIVELGQAEKLRHGAQIKDWHFAPGTYRVYSITGEFLLLGKVENTILTTIKSFFEV